MTTSRAHLLRLLVCLVACLSAQRLASAHDLDFTAADLRLDGSGGLVLSLRCHPDAVYAGRGPQDSVSDSAYQRFSAMDADWKSARRAFLIEYFREHAVVLVDAIAQPTQVAFPAEGTPESASLIDGRWFGHTVLLTGRVPAGATNVSVRLDDDFSPVQLTVTLSPNADPLTETLVNAQTSAQYPLAAGAEPTPQPPIEVMWQYLVLGYLHILPKGLDHILFVLGLFLLSDKLRPLLWQISAFTVAHTITLALATLGLVQLPSSIVEPLIALSIAYVGVENICTKRLMPWRVAVVFLFGLLHGLGFAGVLAELGLPKNQFTLALVSFNIGVEAGQLSVVAIALLLVGWFRHKKWYRPRIVIPGSAIIAAMGLFWAVQRAFF